MYEPCHSAEGRVYEYVFIESDAERGIFDASDQPIPVAAPAPISLDAKIEMKKIPL